MFDQKLFSFHTSMIAPALKLYEVSNDSIKAKSDTKCYIARPLN